jgi:1-acyl-sn-glycerol-3-phosphate acyltransferase
MDISVVAILSGFMVFWVILVFVFAFQQELGVGWPQFSFLNKVPTRLLMGRSPASSSPSRLHFISASPFVQFSPLSTHTPCNPHVSYSSFLPGHVHFRLLRPILLGLYPPQIKMTIFLIIMMVGGVAQSILVKLAHLLYGERAGRQFGHRIMCRTFGFVLPALFGKIEAEGLENLPKDRDDLCIYISNHQSSLDFAFYYALPHSHFQGLCAVAKSSIQFMPGFGAMTVLCGGIMISRKKGSMQQLIEQGTERLHNGINVGLFPQGTRRVPTPTAPPREIKRGFAVLAQKTGRPVVPMTFLYDTDFLSGNRDTSKAGARVIVHKPITVMDAPGDLTKADAHVKAAVQAATEAIVAPILAQMPKGTDKVWAEKRIEETKHREVRAAERDAKKKESKKAK